MKISIGKKSVPALRGNKNAAGPHKLTASAVRNMQATKGSGTLETKGAIGNFIRGGKQTATFTGGKMTKLTTPNRAQTAKGVTKASVLYGSAIGGAVYAAGGDVETAATIGGVGAAGGLAGGALGRVANRGMAKVTGAKVTKGKGKTPDTYTWQKKSK